MEIFLPCFYSFIACFAVCVVFNTRGKMLFYAPLGSALAWFIYLICSPLNNDIFQFFLATVVITIYSELMARVHKVPATGYLLVALLPLVPGGGIYYTMEYCILGNTQMFLETCLHTLGIAGVLALAILLVSSVVRLWSMVSEKRTGKNSEG